MSDLSKEQQEEVDRLVQPAEECEREMLGKNEGRDKAPEDAAGTVTKEEEVKLPKLSASDFRTYNSMAEHMEYYVGTLYSLIMSLD